MRQTIYKTLYKIGVSSKSAKQSEKRGTRSSCALSIHRMQCLRYVKGYRNSKSPVSCKRIQKENKVEDWLHAGINAVPCPSKKNPVTGSVLPWCWCSRCCCLANECLVPLPVRPHCASMWIHFLTSPRDTNTRRGLRADVVDVAHAVDVVDHGGQRKDSKVRLAAPLASPAADHGTQPAAAAEQAESLSSWAREVDAMPAASLGEAVVRFVDRSLAEDKSVPMEVLVQYVCLGLALGNGAKTG